MSPRCLRQFHPRGKNDNIVYRFWKEYLDWDRLEEYDAATEIIVHVFFRNMGPHKEEASNRPLLDTEILLYIAMMSYFYNIVYILYYSING